MIFIGFLLLGLYVISMMALVFGFLKMPIFKPNFEVPINSFTIVIPFRNEAENLPQLLESISLIKYPAALFEIIFVNDASEDISEEIILKYIENSTFSIRLIPNKRISKSPKKDAISEGIRHANCEWIATTDADCELPQHWLGTIDAFIQQVNRPKREKPPLMVCGPVLYKSDNSFLQHYQQLDGLSLQAITIGSFGHKKPLMCNGANLAYNKQAFMEVAGFTGNNHIASGDDIFLMEKMQIKFPGQIKYLKSKEGMVLTQPQTSWKSIIQQRIRWASKTSAQKNPIVSGLGILVILINLFVLLTPLNFILFPEKWLLLLLLLFIKIMVDFIAVHQTANFFDVKISIFRFIYLPFIYAVLTTCVAFAGFRGSYSWKDRKY